MSAVPPLAKYDVVRRALARANSVDEVKQIRNKAEAIRAYARQAGDRTLEIDAAEIRIKAERRLGQMIAEQKATVGLAKGGGDKRSKHRVKRKPGDPPTLAEAGINKYLANRARRWAALTEKEFTEYLDLWRSRAARANERVTIEVLRAARSKKQLEHFQEELKKANPRRDTGPYFDLDEDDADESSPPLQPSLRELDRQRYQKLLERNPTATFDYTPRKFDSIVKIVADTLVRCDVIRRYLEWPDAMRKFAETIDTMDDRIERLLKAIDRTSKIAKDSAAKTEG